MIVERKRHIAKTISYRILSTIIGFIIMWWVSGSIKIGATFSIIELVYKPIPYYIHERVWYNWIKYGLKNKKNGKPQAHSMYINSIPNTYELDVDIMVEAKGKELAILPFLN
jgi:uncharacterized membrane protein